MIPKIENRFYLPWYEVPGIPESPILFWKVNFSYFREKCNKNKKKRKYFNKVMNKTKLYSSKNSFIDCQKCEDAFVIFNQFFQ